MWHDLGAMGVPIAEKIVRTLLVYVLLVILFRVTGKRGLASLNTFDFVVFFLLSNVVQNAVIGPDNSLLGGVVGAVTLVVANAAVNRWLAVDAHAERLLEGTATTVIRDGRIVPGALRRLGLRGSELRHAVMVQTSGPVQDVARGSLEPDGRLLIEPGPSAARATRADITRLEQRLAAIEDLLRAGGPAGGGPAPGNPPPSRP